METKKDVSAQILYVHAKSCHNTQHEKLSSIIQGQLFATQTVASEL